MVAMGCDKGINMLCRLLCLNGIDTGLKLTCTCGLLTYLAAVVVQFAIAICTVSCHAMMMSIAMAQLRMKTSWILVGCCSEVAVAIDC